MLKPAVGKIHPKGWILEYLLRDKAGICGTLDKLCADASCGIFEDKKVKDEINGFWSSWWPGETEGNWRDAYIRLAFALDDQELKDNCIDYINSILKHQESDGYIGIFVKNERFGNAARSGELWTQSRIMNCLLSYYDATNDERIIPALERLVDLIVLQYGPLANGRSLYEVPDEDGSKAHSLMVIEPILRLYDILKKQEYLDFCEFLYHDYSVFSPGAKFPCYDISAIMVTNPNEPFVGHGPHTCEQLRIPFLLYAKTGNKEYYSIFISGYEKLKRYLSLSGSCKSDEMIGAFQDYIPKEERVGSNIGECFPIPSVGYEYCSTTELMFTFQAALSHTLDMNYADKEEWLVMNAAMAARRQDGKAILYLCSDNLYAATKEVGDRWDYSPTHVDAAVCCAPNSCKIMPSHLNNMWIQSENGELYAVYYGPCELSTQVAGQEMTITEQTIYPFENCVRFQIKTATPTAAKLHFRVPQWCDSVTIQRNDSVCKTQSEQVGNGHSEILSAIFCDGDEIYVEFRCKPRILTAVDQTKAIAFGPMLYSYNIEGEGENHFSYEVEDFHDTNYLPVKGKKWDYTLLTQESDPHQCTSIKIKNSDDFVWDNSPITLQTLMLSESGAPTWVELVPIGCTNLRRTTFTNVTHKKEGLF